MTYQEAKEEAQALADASGLDYGVERAPYEPGGYRVLGLPGKRWRQGHETRCEVVSCSIWERIRPGHGPGAS